MKAKILSLAALFGCTLTLFSNNASAINTPYPLLADDVNDGKLGSILEAYYQEAQGYCINGTPSKVVLEVDNGYLKKKTKISAIPPQIFDSSIKLNDQVFYKRGESIGRLFSNIYSNKTVSSGQVDPAKYLIANYLQDPATLAADGFDGSLYDYNCTGSFAATLAANAESKLPIAKMAAGIKADQSNNAKLRFQFVSAKMQSPIWKYYMSTTSNDQKTYAAFVLWQWYANNNDAVADGKERYILSWADAVTVFKLTTYSKETRSEVNAQLAFSVPAVSMESSLKTFFGSNTSSEIKSYGFAVRKANKEESAGFERLPSLSTVAGTLSSVRSHLDTKSTDYRLFNAQVDHKQIIIGVPQAVCAGKWGVEKKDGVNYRGSLSIGIPQFIEATESNLPQCILPVGYTPDSNFDLPKSLVLDFFITKSIIDNKGQTYTAKIQADKVTYSTSGLPKIQASKSSGQFDNGFPTFNTLSGITFYNYQWSLELPVSEEESTSLKIEKIEISKDSSIISCGSRKIYVDATPVYPKNNNFLSLIVRHNTSSRNELIDNTSLDFCSFDAELSVQLKNGVSLNRKIPSSNIFYPSIAKPAPTAGQPVAIVENPPMQLLVSPTASNPISNSFSTNVNDHP